MKKILLLISFLVISLSAIHAADGQLNAYAYGAQFAYDPNTQTIAFNWSLPSEASALRIVAIDAEGKKYVLKEYGTTPSMAYSSVMSIWDAVDELPLNEDLSLAIEVKTADRTKHEVIASKEYTMQSPFSIDIDNNPYSKYFGLKYVTQMDGSSSLPRGVYIFDQTNIKAKDAQLGAGITLPDSWWAGTHGIPHMVRVIPDGSGRLLISSSDQSQDTYLWLAEPSGNGSVPTYTTWKTVITNNQIVEWTKLTGARFANASFDIRSNGDNWDIILYTADAKNGTEFWASNIYTGVYSVPKSSSDLTGGTYTPYTVESGGIINQRYTRSMLNASVNFDEYGGVLYNAHSDDTDASDPTFKHRTLNGDFNDDYVDGNYLSRTFVPKGVRFSPDFKKLAVAQNAKKDANGTELRIYDVTQTDGNSHSTFSNGISVDVITGSSEKAFVHDIAWDHGKNVYITVRNQTTKVGGEYIHGIYAVALNLNGEAISTPLQDPNENKYFHIDCLDGNYTISLQQKGGTGTLTGAGTYASCTAVTVTAVPDNQYKFIRWTEGGQEVSREKSYTFYATRDRNLVAEFEYAEYDVTYYHLLANDVDVLGWDMNNENLWALFMAYFNDYNISYRGVQKNSGADRASQGIKAALTFIDGTNAINYISEFMTNDRSQMKWLGNYILSVASSQGKSISTAKDWRANVCAFFKCEKQPTNGNGYHDSSYGVSADFTEKGNSTYWHHYYTQHVGRLNPILNYKDVLPSTIVELNPIVTSSGRATYPTWYNCNVDGKLLGWYYGDDLNKAIVHEVNQSGALFATWVDKSISEDEDKQQKNSDVIYLLNHHNGTHNIEVDRTLQANMYNTFCLPFGVNAKSQLPSELQDATFVKFDGVENLYETSGDEVAVLNFSEVTFLGADTLEAGKPYLVLPKTDISTSKVYTNIKTDYKNGDKNNPTVVERAKTVTQETANGGHVSFCGTINSVSIPEQTVILVADSRLTKTTEAGNMLGLRGYFILDDPYIQSLAEDGKLYLSMKKPVTTSIPVAPEAEQQTKPEVRKIMRDGQIYILRGEEVYTLTGNRIK